MNDIFAAVDLAGAIAFVVASGLVVMGIRMAFKGVDLGKRAIAKA